MINYLQLIHEQIPSQSFFPPGKALDLLLVLMKQGSVLTNQ